MGALPKQLPYWSPRVLTMLYAAFLALFALDAFDEGLDAWHTAGALAVHLVPSLIVLGVLAVAWRREWIAAALFPALAALYVAWTWNKPLDPAVRWIWWASIAAPLLFVGALFLFNWIRRSDLRLRP